MTCIKPLRSESVPIKNSSLRAPENLETASIQNLYCCQRQNWNLWNRCQCMNCVPKAMRSIRNPVEYYEHTKFTAQEFRSVWIRVTHFHACLCHKHNSLSTISICNHFWLMALSQYYIDAWCDEWWMKCNQLVYSQGAYFEMFSIQLLIEIESIDGAVLCTRSFILEMTEVPWGFRRKWFNDSSAKVFNWFYTM